MMNESLYKWYCDYMLPKGPQGKTADEVDAVLGKYMHLPRQDRLYSAMKELLAYKRGLEPKQA